MAMRAIQCAEGERVLSVGRSRRPSPTASSGADACGRPRRASPRCGGWRGGRPSRSRRAGSCRPSGGGASVSMHSARNTVMTRGPSTPAITSGMRASMPVALAGHHQLRRRSRPSRPCGTRCSAPRPSSRAMSLSDVFDRPCRAMHSTVASSTGSSDAGGGPGSRSASSGKAMTSSGRQPPSLARMQRLWTIVAVVQAGTASIGPPGVRRRRPRSRSVRAVTGTVPPIAGRRRLAAIGALVLVAGIVVSTVVRVASEPRARHVRASPRRGGSRRFLGGAHHDEAASDDRRRPRPCRRRHVDRQRDQQ